MGWCAKTKSVRGLRKISGMRLQGKTRVRIVRGVLMSNQGFK